MWQAIIQAAGAVIYADGIEALARESHAWSTTRDPLGLQHRHLLHHISPEEHLALAATWPVGVLFAVHAVTLWVLGLKVALVAIAAYLVMLDVAHRAQHKLGRGYHLAHHDRPVKRWNIFLSFWDFVLKTI